MKKIIYILTAIIISIILCNCINSELQSSKEEITADNLSKLHALVKTDFQKEITKSNLKQNMNKVITENFTNDSIEHKLNENFQYLNQNNIHDLFSKNGLSPELIDQLDFYLINANDPNVYKNLIEKYQLKSYDEAKLLFTFIETYNLVENELNSRSEYLGIKGKSNIIAKGISAGCVLAIAGTVVSTVGAVTVTTGAGLAIWAVGKALSLASLALSCP